ncbi:MAG: DUF3137 domain-containing protein [Mesorhizobium sp.]|nr:DUF3137 domain-containing protein [bacterium M00.F.Ca.ET.205.01.1.1]TGU55336.1 DUF3137 domain-containing protein [bacterium M00.F.Ca.ET.152.01.1.1]TGV40374.1 DUF3137 domain-containing protein [Mesorhizobium sp. M00.F.Ca.ET.186.01.1.1]TGZ45371.1 DUF3137 domain-containing protein [bacterium M00.F.Ca.ET.162.01.1.1]TJW34489.1 MAG: DUF3137 domain-containing protein [Mesorhizobium sp.]
METADFMPDEAVIAEIRKDIEAYEAARASAVWQVRWRVPLFIGLVLVAVALIAWLFNTLADPNEQWFSTPHVFLYVIGFVAAILLYFRAIRPAARLQQSFRETLMPIIFGFIGDMRYQHDVTPNSFDRLPRETVGGFTMSRFDDMISGRYDGFAFELYEADLWDGGATKNKATTFKGVVVAFETIEPFPGILVAARRANAVMGFFRGIFTAKMQELSSGVPELDAAYEFRTDNVEAARPLVTGRLAQALKWLGETWPDEPARVALNGSDGFLLLPQPKNFFELPAISVPLDYQTHVAPMISDMGAMLATAALVRKIGARDGATG